MNREHLYWIFIPALAFALADLTVSYLDTKPSARRIFTPTPEIRKVDLAGTESTLARLLETSQTESESDEDQSRRSSGAEPPTEASRLPKGLGLKGTMAGMEGDGLAFFSLSGKSLVLSTGDFSPTRAFQVVRVESGKVVVRSENERLTLFIGQEVQEPKAAPTQTPSQAKHLAQDEIRDFLEDPSQLRGLKAEPFYRQGEMIGVILKLPPKHPLTRLGLISGDLVKSINQRPIDSPGALSGLIPMLRNSSTLVIEIERSGQPERLVVELD